MAYSSSSLDPLIAHYSKQYNVPESLVRRVIVRESNYNPAARNGPYYGLMQISHATASGMGYSGSPSGLLDAETNLRYAVRYLAGAYVTAKGNPDQAMRFYARGYYYDAKRAGLLEESGLR
jgi:soluble lytic murein transglycosylase-like protein